MLKDLHIHLERGEYNLDWIGQFVSQAKAMDIGEITLLEHSIRIKELHPCFKEAREYSPYQQKWVDNKAPSAHTLAEYLELVDRVRQEDFGIKINFGLEVCYFEQHRDFMGELLSDKGLDHLIGSVHWIDNWTFNQRKYQWKNRDVDQIYERYYQISNSLIKSNIFDTIAHPDLVTCHGLLPSYDLADTYKELFKNANEHNVCIEMNTSKGLGLNEQMFEIAKECNVTFSTGSDAHRPQDVGRGIKQVTELIEG